MQLSYDYDYVKQHRPLKLKKKIYEFYTAPITKFWADSVSGIDSEGSLKIQDRPPGRGGIGP